MSDLTGWHGNTQLALAINSLLIQAGWRPSDAMEKNPYPCDVCDNHLPKVAN